MDIAQVLLLYVRYDVICIIDACAYADILRNSFSYVQMYKLPVLQTCELYWTCES